MQIKLKGNQGMLTIKVGGEEVYDEESGSFQIHGDFELQLEHSLVSLSKWESMHEIPFLGPKSKSPEQLASYVECMLLTENPPEDFLHKLSKEDYEKINAYIDRKMSATTFHEIQPEARNQEIITSELIYYWLTVYQIPFEVETWHLNRLFTLVRVASLKQGKPKKMSRSEQARRMRELNAQRRQQYNTKG
jgi:hypothetical protein